MILSAIALIVFAAIGMWIAKWQRVAAYASFFAESASDDKEREIEIFWSRVKAAKSNTQKRTIYDGQAAYMHHIRWNRAWIILSCISMLVAIGFLFRSGLMPTVIL